MAGFADLLTQAQPAIFGGGVSDSLSAGRTYKRRFIEVDDSNGDPINLTGITGTCTIVEADRTTIILTPTFTGGVGEFTLSIPKATTAGKFTGAGTEYLRGRMCWWSLVLDDGTNSVQVWMADNSKFTIHKGA